MGNDTCPNGCNLQGEPIQQEYIDKGYYRPGATHYSRMIGWDGGREGVYDGIICWACPDCGLMWHRWATGEGYHDRVAAWAEREGLSLAPAFDPAQSKEKVA